MDDIKKNIDAAYNWLSKAKVSGESVDYSAMARQKLRSAYDLESHTPTEIDEHPSKDLLAEAYNWLSKVQVSGESVDYLAMARQELRAAYAVKEDEKDA